MLPGLLLVSTAMAEPAAFALLPFGTDLYLQKKPVRGLVYSLTQAVGLATAIVGTVEANQRIIAEDNAGAESWKVVTASGVTLTGASYVLSVVDASNLHAKDSVAWLQDWDNDRVVLAYSARILPGQVLPAPGQVNRVR